MKTYSVHARPWTEGWELYIDDVGVTQSHTMQDAAEMARDYIALDLDIPGDSFEVDVAPEDSELERLWRLPDVSEDMKAGLIEWVIRTLEARDNPGQESA